jgi:predicted nucleic acid-binding protein
LERAEVRSYITDASVAVKWFVEEQGTPNALKLKQLFEDGEVNLEAPSLLGYEVTSALRFHPKIRFTLKQFRAVAEALDQMQISREPSLREWSVAFRLSIENAISIYDAIYVAFALSSRSKMVTADAALLNRLRSPEARQSVMILADLDL